MARTEQRHRARRTEGRRARAPHQVPREGWIAVLQRVKVQLKADHVSLLAAGVAFKGLLALVPALVAVLSIWGMVADPDRAAEQLEDLTAALPDAAGALIEEQLTAIAAGDPGTLGLALAVSLAVALWSASAGMLGLVEGCNVAYNEVDQRSFPVRRGLALVLTAGAALFLVVTLGLIVVLPAAMDALGLGRLGTLLVQIGQWPLLALLAMGGLAVLYTVAPDRDSRARPRWTTPGAIIATLLWLLGSAAFTVYVNVAGDFDETYGALGGVVVLMLWLLLTSFIVLLGAEINAELERQTVVDTTVGEPQPVGERGAEPADNLPEDFESPHL